MNLPGWRTLYLPFFLFLSIFIADKICSLDGVKVLTQMDATYLYFDYKQELLDELEAVYKKESIKPWISEKTGNPEAFRKRILVILGSSRLLYFDHQAFKTDYPDWELFNFSAPVTAPAYYAYILERIYERGVKPDYILIEADAFQFNDASSAFQKSNLAYTFDMRFILKNFNLFTRDEASSFLARWLFAAYKYPPRLDQIFERVKGLRFSKSAPFIALEKDALNRYNLALEALDKHQRENRGAGKSIIPRENWYERDFAMLQGTSERTVNWLYRPFVLSRRQFAFLKQALQLARENGSFVLTIRPPVSRPMVEELEQDRELSPLLEAWQLAFQKMDPPVVHLNLLKHEEFFCNTFVDASHMSLDCYHALMPVLMKEWWKARAH